MLLINPNLIKGIKTNLYQTTPNRSGIKKGAVYDSFTKTSSFNPESQFSSDSSALSGYSPTALKIKTAGIVPESFKTDVEKKLQNIPAKWLKLLKDNNYKIILTDDIDKVYKRPERNDLKTNHLGLTYTNSSTGENFICFSTKTKPCHLQKVINHEIGHGICNIKKLDSNPLFRQALYSDTQEIVNARKLDGLTNEERALLSKYFFNPKAKLPVDEIIADLFAWHHDGGGCYGSTITLKKENPELMFNIFPNLSKRIADL